MRPASTILTALLTAVCTLAKAASANEDSTPIVSVVPDLPHLQKWHDSNGDTADPFWADDDNLYHFTCDGRGFGKETRNLCFNKLTGPDLLHLTGELVNSMDEYGKANATERDGATWKVCGQECIDGIFYTFVVRNIYGNKSRDKLLRQTSFNASLIKSADHGKTWTRSARANYESPMWPGKRFGAPCFIHYGKNGGSVTRDKADEFVYAMSNNGFWNGGDDFILARVRRADLPKLNAADWTYYAGGDPLKEKSWCHDLAVASPVLNLPGKLGWTAPVFIPALNRYLLTAWYVIPTLRKWFQPKEVVYEFYDAPHPWGPWTYVSSFSDHFLALGNMYGPNLCAKYQEKRGDDVLISLFTSGCQFEDKPDGLYKMWRSPLVLKTRPQPHATLVNDDHPFVRYFGSWQASTNRSYHDYLDDVHVSKAPGDAAEIKFTGTGVEWLTERYSDEGTAEVYLDGEPRGTVDLGLENWPRLAQIPVFRAQGLPSGPHTLRIVNTGTNYVLIDAFSVTARADIPATTAQPRRPLPSASHLRWHQLEFYGFLHFTVNTFTGKEWGLGDEPESSFNPTDFDPDQIVTTFKDAGMKGIILTAKHHDGFCLWPSKFTKHSVKNSPWRNSQGDVVREISEACRRHGLKFGIYLSPWDRNHPDYGLPAYVTYFHNQLRELLTGYGPIFEVWFDGAAGTDGRGGEGWYGGSKGVRRMDPMTYYRWPEIFKMIRELQPDAHIHGDIGPDSRWGGNENGEAGDPCWVTVRSRELEFPAFNQTLDLHGHRDGDLWLPSELPHSIRCPSWFWRAEEDNKVEAPEVLFQKYLNTVGRGAAFLLGLTPDTRGQIPEADVQALRGFRRILDDTFRQNLAIGAKLAASNTRGGQDKFKPAKCSDGQLGTYWSTDDGVTTPELVLEFDKPVTFNLVSLREYLPLGQRIDAVALHYWKDGQWAECAKATSIGNRRLLSFPEITTAKARLRITKSSAAPALAELGIYRHDTR